MTASPHLAPTTPIRLLPVPHCEPPFDDERTDRRPRPDRSPRAARSPRTVAPVQGTLALAFLLPSGLPAQPQPSPALRLVPDLPDVTGRPAGSDADANLDSTDFGPQPTSRAALPEPRAWAGRLVQALVEVLGGDRPLSQLVRWTTTEVYEDVAALLPSARRGGRGAVRRTPDETTRAAVRSVRLTEPADGVAEVAATVRRGRRTTAVALRLEGLDGRWQCTAMQIG
jgi:hypothetical protein